MSKNPTRNYAIEYVGGKRTDVEAVVSAAIVAAAEPIGDPLGDASDGDLPLLETLPTDETDGTLVPHPDTVGGVVWGPGGTPDAALKNEGGQEGVKAHGSVGATVNIDPTDGNIHTLTLTANCTATILAPVGAGGAGLELWVTQGGAGGWTLTIVAASFAWDGATPTPVTTAGVTVRYVLERVPGTANDWIGDLVGGGGSALTVKDEGSALPTAATSLDFVGLGVTASGTGAGKTITIPGGAAALDDLTDVVISSPALAQLLRYSGSAWVNAALIVSDYPYHSETLCDSSGPILQSNGDVITVVGVPN